MALVTVRVITDAKMLFRFFLNSEHIYSLERK